MFETLKNLVKPKHVVIIDDDQNVRKIFGDILEKRRYRVTRAASMGDLGGTAGREALEDADVFLLDIFISPGPTGVEIAKILRNDGIEAPICFITAKDCSLKEEEHLTSLLPDLYFLQKPISPDALLAKVAELAALME